MVSFVLRKMKPFVEKENYEVQQRYDNIVMLCRQCFKYQDHSMMENLKAMVYELNDDLREGCAIREHRRYEYVVRDNSRISDEMLLIALSRKYDTAVIDANCDAELILLFRQIWLSGKTSPAVITALGDFIARSNSFVLSLVVYAMMLRCVRYYDRAMVRLLMEMRTPEAFVALAVILVSHSERISSDENQRLAFAMFCADGDCGAKLTQAMNLLFKTNETKVIAREFEKNIYPEVLKKRSDLHIDQIIDKGKNPDWESLLEGSPLMDKMRKINDMQLKGKDVNFATFKAMKGYPFFSDTAHWFFPFTLNYRKLTSVQGVDEKGVELLSRVANICDSDRYSLFMMFKSMGIHNMEAALGNMGVSKMNELQDMVDDDLKKSDEVQFALRLRYAVMNVFRFYNLAPNHSDFISPFEKIQEAGSLTVLKNLFSVDVVATFANAAFSARDYATALELFEICVDEVIDSDVHVFQKMGYCHEQLERYSSAIEYYDKSDIILPDDVWTLRRMAHCHSAKNDDQSVCIKIYRRLMALLPEDNAVAKSLATLLCGNELYGEAIPLLFKLEYAMPCYSVWANLALALSLTGKYDDAAKYFYKACKASDAEPDIFVFAAVNNIMMGEGECEALVNEAYGIINDAGRFLEVFDNGYVVEMMAKFTQEQRENLINTINKTIIEL